MCNDSAYPKNSRRLVESQKRVKKTKRLFLASSLGNRNRDGEIASHIPTAPSTHIPAIATGYSSRYVDITLYGSSQLFGSLLTTHCFCLAIVRRIYHCDWSEGRFRCCNPAVGTKYKDTLVLLQRQEPDETNPTNQTQVLQVSLCRSPTSHAFIHPTAARA
jgi:hypothetical protein